MYGQNNAENGRNTTDTRLDFEFAFLEWRAKQNEFHSQQCSQLQRRLVFDLNCGIRTRHDEARREKHALELQPLVRAGLDARRGDVHGGRGRVERDGGA